MCRNLFLFFLAFLPAVAAGSELPVLPQDLSVRSWTKEQGLPDNSVISVLQTKDGYLWIGTAKGLVRFDGIRFVSVAPQGGMSDAIFVTALCEDSYGRLWIGTQKDGLLQYVDGAITRFDAGNVLHGDTINSIAEDSRGGVWLGTPFGAIRLSDSSFKRFTTADGLPNDFVSSVHVARSGTVWITTRGGMCQFKDDGIVPYPFRTDSPGRSPESLGVYEDRRGNLWAFGDTYLVNLNEEKYLNHFGSGDMTSSTRIWSLCEGRRGELWIGTSGRGLYLFVENQFVPVTLRSGALTSDVRTLCEDREGNLWLGTHGDGLVRLQPRNMRLLDVESGLPDRPAICLSLNSQSVLRIGLERGGLFELAGDRFRPFPGEAGNALQNLVSTLLNAPDSSLWVGTPGAGLYRVAGSNMVHYTTANGLSDNNIRSLALDTNGAVWAGTASGGLHRFGDGWPSYFGPHSGLPSAPITALLGHRSGGVWIGFEEGDLFRGFDGKFQPALDSGSLGSRRVTALFEDSLERLWIGTAGGRLGCLIGQHFLSWDLHLGSPEHAIHGILLDDEGNLWASTSRAIYHISHRDVTATLNGRGLLHPQLLFKSDTMSGSDASYGWPRAARTQEGRLWFALNSGIVTFDLRAPATELLPPPVVIEEVIVNGKALAPNRRKSSSTTVPARLPSDVSSLSVQFTALNFSAPERIRLRYRLDGYNSDWITGGEGTRSVMYDRLPYGAYNFRVQAGAEGGSWFEDEASFAFLIPIPLWRTSWAVTSYVLIAVALVASAARLVSNRRLRRRLMTLSAQQAMERERMRIAQDMHDEIGSKLTKISFMSERAIGQLEGHAPVAQKLESIARTSRDLLQSLDEIVWAVNPHNDTLEHLAAYLGQYATEYLQNTAVQCELRLQRGLPNYPLSAEARHNLFLAFEESLNNALKHGRPTRVRIEMEVEGSYFRIRMEDNGCGFDAAAVKKSGASEGPAATRQGNGLPNMRQRLDSVGGKFEIESQPGRGTKVCFSVPLTGHVIVTTKR